jgi:V/A-type H+-transporting ATPase subunit I
MLGTPGNDEVDPILLVPVTVSLLFGYMFPDLGHGLILALVSGLLYRRWPQGRFLIACGLSAALFGVVFGECFGLEGLIEPLWIHPLDQPLLILLPPLIFGVGLMLLGLVFNGIEAHWRHETRQWLLRDAAVLLMYGSACGGIFHPALLWITAGAFGWFVLGQILPPNPHRLRNLATNLAHLAQSLFELLLNTLSFLRVGAFALAHAALSAAVMQMALGIDNQIWQFVFLVLGHVLIIIIEGLVVFVQTTRLVLFEFFTRFLKAEGRVFRPLASPTDQAARDR